MQTKITVDQAKQLAVQALISEANNQDVIGNELARKNLMEAVEVIKNLCTSKKPSKELSKE